MCPSSIGISFPSCVSFLRIERLGYLRTENNRRTFNASYVCWVGKPYLNTSAAPVKVGSTEKSEFGQTENRKLTISPSLMT